MHLNNTRLPFVKRSSTRSFVDEIELRLDLDFSWPGVCYLIKLLDWSCRRRLETLETWFGLFVNYLRLGAASSYSHQAKSQVKNKILWLSYWLGFKHAPVTAPIQTIHIWHLHRLILCFPKWFSVKTRSWWDLIATFISNYWVKNSLFYINRSFLLCLYII